VDEGRRHQGQRESRQVRLSCHLPTTTEDIDRCLEALLA